MKRAKKNNKLTTLLDREIEPIVKLWIMRLMVPLGMHREFTLGGNFSDENLAHALGLEDWIENSGWSIAKMDVHFRHLYKEIEADASNISVSPVLRKNVERIANLMGLTPTDCRIIEFATYIKTNQKLESALRLIGRVNNNTAYKIMAVILDLPYEEIQKAFATNANLTKTGMIGRESENLFGMGNDFEDSFGLASPTFANTLLDNHLDYGKVLVEVAKECSKSELGWHDFAHVNKELEIVKPFLKRSNQLKRTGVNILIYGQPGTGKSQLARVIAQELSLDIYEITDEDPQGMMLTGDQRLKAHRRAQYFVDASKSLFLFDEAEDVFGRGEKFFRSAAQSHKSMMHRALEEAKVPTIWLTNSIHGIDNSTIRRFDIVFELPIPPQNQREKILANEGAGILSEEMIKRMAGCEHLAPALIARALTVAQLANDVATLGDVGEAVEFLINKTLQAQGKNKIAQLKEHKDLYDPAFIHSDIDLLGVAEGLRRLSNARICLYGAPGTGKTAYGRWLSEYLGKKLMIRRVSDLTDMYVGETEKNIAQAFRDAQDQGAILLIDEVDGFLQDRRGAKNSWEATAVNEMLTQMEEFQGIFIASTNLMESLDQAALRRFDLKVKFNYLRPDQARALFARYCTVLGIPDPDEEIMKAVGKVANLTPGDFAVAKVKHRFKPLQNAQELLTILVGECDLKESREHSKIGFIH
jgi:transitional endoplasmic reticulum ATPase